MIGLFDRDVFYKLAVCNLWEPCLDVFGIAQPYRLDSTSNAKSNRSILSRNFVGEKLAKAEELVRNVVKSAPVIPDALVENVFQTEPFQNMKQTDGIDGGELLIASIVLMSPQERILITSDKRFIVSLRDNHPEYWAAMEGSALSFEKCLIHIHAKFGFQFIKECAYEMRDCDNSLRNCFGSGNDEASFLDGLDSYMRDSTNHKSLTSLNAS